MRKHRCDVMRPATTKSTRGQERGQDEVLLRGVPCSITATGGAESEQAGSTYVDATYEVECYGDPRKPIRAKDYLQFTDGRRFDISFVTDVKQNGRELVLSCHEQVGENV